METKFKEFIEKAMTPTEGVAFTTLKPTAAFADFICKAYKVPPEIVKSIERDAASEERRHYSVVMMAFRKFLYDIGGEWDAKDILPLWVKHYESFFTQAVVKFYLMPREVPHAKH